VRTRSEDGETVFLYKGVEAIRWRPMEEALPSPVAANLERALLWFFHGHPLLGGKLAAEGKAPQHLKVRWRVLGNMLAEDFQWVDAQWCEACSALPDDAQPGLWVGGALETEMAPVMLAASAGKFRAIGSDDYLRRVNSALDRGAPLEALLWFLERLLQDGVRRCPPDEVSHYCHVQNRMFSPALASADLQTFRQNLNKRSLEAANAIAALRDRVEANAYYIDLASVNAMPPSAFARKQPSEEPLKSAEQRMATALAAMPKVPAVYRDIGNMYFAAVNTRHAWLAWEMGRANPGRTSEPNLWQHIDAIESQVRRRRPEFF
jgi:hypothetical protein